MNFHIDPNSAADAGDEYSIQVRFRSRMKMLAPRVRLVATPNGMKTTAWAANRAKSEGMSKGFCDLTILAPGKKVAFIEMKAKGGRLSEEQINWLNFLHTAGFHCGCFKSVNTAVQALIDWGFPVEKPQ